MGGIFRNETDIEGGQRVIPYLLKTCFLNMLNKSCFLNMFDQISGYMSMFFDFIDIS
jgi:hypothetical protein